jgi:molybdenum cofactor guanylyltransferase
VTDLAQLTGLVLAGGKGSRMGGVDKGLQPFRGASLAAHALARLTAQQLGAVAINANRNLAAYEQLGAAIWPDSLGDYPGPLAGFLTGLERCETRYLLTVPCDAPLFPLDLAVRLHAALSQSQTSIAIAQTLEDGRLSPQPVFALIDRCLLENLKQFTQHGGRKVSAWTALHQPAYVAFNLPSDDPQAFYNANTIEQLQALEKLR